MAKAKKRAGPKKAVPRRIVEPTRGMRVTVERVADIGEHYCLTVEHEKLAPWMREQCEVDAAHINRLLEAEERRQVLQNQAQRDEDDVLVDVGDMSEDTLAKVRALRPDKAYQDMCEDFVGNFNHIVLQGIKPLEAMHAMSQAFAIVLGGCLRANLPWDVAKFILTKIMESAAAYEKMVRVITDGRKLNG